MKKNLYSMWLTLSAVFILAHTNSNGQVLRFRNFDVKVNRSINPVLPQNQSFDNRLYFIAQFEKTPSLATHHELKQSGANLLYYIPDNAYYLSVPQGYDVAKLTNAGVVSIISIHPDMKVSKHILNNNIPDYAMRGSGVAEVFIKLYPDVDMQKAISALQIAESELISADLNSKLIRGIFPVGQLKNISMMPFINYMEPIYSTPVTESYTDANNNRSNMLNILGHNGAGIGITVGDDGAVGNHIDFKGRATTVTAGANNHATYVSGIIAGAGNLNAKEPGIARGATLKNYTYPVNIDSALNDYDNSGYTISNNSIGDGCNDGYTAMAQMVDQQIWSRTGLMHIFSAGDAGNFDCGYIQGADWGNITGGSKQAKNSITVGTVTNDDIVPANSSRGPMTDGRVAPLLVATGEGVTATAPNNGYSAQSGTSGAAAAVSGAFAQLSQAYKDMNAVPVAPSALIKAALLNGADDLGETDFSNSGIIGPYWTYGYGRLNARRSLDAIHSNTYWSGTVINGDSVDFSLTIPSGVAKVKVMLCWHDMEASINAAPALVNDLDLRMIDNGGVEYLPLGQNPNPNAFTLPLGAIPKPDHINNQEQVVLNAPAAGTYTLRVNGFNIAFGTQDFYVVYQLINDDVTITHPFFGENLVPGETEQIRWDSYGDNGFYTIDYSNDGGTTWNTITTVGSNVRLANWTVPSDITPNAKIRVSKTNGTSSTSGDFNIMTIPQNVQIVYQCLDSMMLTWQDTTANATAYQVYILGANYMDSVAYVTDTFVTLYNVNPYNEQWYAVHGVSANGAISRRTNAVQGSIGLTNCVIAVDGSVANLSPASASGQSCSFNLTPIVSVWMYNQGINPMFDFNVGYVLNGGAPVIDLINDTIQPGDSLLHTFAGTITLNGSGINTLQSFITLSGDGNSFNDTIVSIIDLVSAAPVLPNYVEDFEAFTLCTNPNACGTVNCQLINGWVNLLNGAEDDHDWTVNTGGTPTPQTGPQGDHTSGFGNYVYTEASNCFNQEAIMVSPCIDLTNATFPSLVYWYHMNGQAMGDMYVDLYAGGSWVNIDLKSGQQGNQWTQAIIGLDNYIGQIVNIRFRGITGAQSSSDMALDDIGIGYYGATPATVQATDFIVAPNPATNLVSITLMNAGAGQATLEIMDAKGSLVKSENLTNANINLTTTMDVSQLESGIYMIRVVSGNKAATRKLVIK